MTAADSISATLETPRLESVLTARASLAQLQRLWADMTRPDELSSPGPTRTISVKLSSGHAATVVFHERHDLIEILATIGRGLEAGLTDLLASLSIAPEAVTWTHPSIVPVIASPRIAIRGAEVCPHCGQSVHDRHLEQLLARLGITDEMVSNLRDHFQNVEIDEYLDTARDYLKSSGGKATTYAKENPGQVAAGIFAVAVGAGLIYAAMREK